MYHNNKPINISSWFCVKKFDVWILYFEAKNITKLAVFIRNKSGESTQFFLLSDSFYSKQNKTKTLNNRETFNKAACFLLLACLLSFCDINFVKKIRIIGKSI